MAIEFLVNPVDDTQPKKKNKKQNLDVFPGPKTWSVHKVS
jgi:hypothetical protein